MEELARLQRWYAANCDGAWEHAYGISIDTLDNPGWKFEVDLVGTPLVSRTFEPLYREAQGVEADWIRCEVKEGKFLGYGGASNLSELLSVFLAWGEHVV